MSSDLDFSDSIIHLLHHFLDHSTEFHLGDLVSGKTIQGGTQLWMASNPIN